MVEEKEEKLDLKYISIVVGCSLILGLILTFTLGTFAWKEMTAARAEAKTRATVLSDAETRLANLKTLSSKAETLKTQNQTVLAALPQDKDISTLFVQFEQIGKQTGVDISTVAEANSNVVPASGMVQAAGYSLSGKADAYQSIKEALSKFQSALRVLSISSLEISGNTAKNLDVKLEITTYLRGDK